MPAFELAPAQSGASAAGDAMATEDIAIRELLMWPPRPQGAQAAPAPAPAQTLQVQDTAEAVIGNGGVQGKCKGQVARRGKGKGKGRRRGKRKGRGKGSGAATYAWSRCTSNWHDRRWQTMAVTPATGAQRAPGQRVGAPAQRVVQRAGTPGDSAGEARAYMEGVYLAAASPQRHAAVAVVAVGGSTPAGVDGADAEADAVRSFVAGAYDSACAHVAEQHVVREHVLSAFDTAAEAASN